MAHSKWQDVGAIVLSPDTSLDESTDIVNSPGTANKNDEKDVSNGDDTTEITTEGQFLYVYKLSFLI